MKKMIVLCGAAVMFMDNINQSDDGSQKSISMQDNADLNIPVSEQTDNNLIQN